jgi:hypothetical protein
MKRLFLLSALTATVWGASSLQSAHAGLDVSINFGPAPCYPVYYAPCPPPVVYYPQPVVYVPAYYAGPVYRPCPPGAYYAPRPYYYGGGYARMQGKQQQDRPMVRSNAGVARAR